MERAKATQESEGARKARAEAKQDFRIIRNIQYKKYKIRKI